MDLSPLNWSYFAAAGRSEVSLVPFGHIDAQQLRDGSRVLDAVHNLTVVSLRLTVQAHVWPHGALVEAAMLRMAHIRNDDLHAVDTLGELLKISQCGCRACARRGLRTEPGHRMWAVIWRGMARGSTVFMINSLQTLNNMLGAPFFRQYLFWQISNRPAAAFATTDEARKARRAGSGPASAFIAGARTATSSAKSRIFSTSSVNECKEDTACE